MGVLFAEERKHYHERLLQEGILTIDKNGVPSNADKASKLSVRIAASMGNDYMVAPDVVVYRQPVSDEEINRPQVFVDDSVCTMADLRKKYNSLPILHASISAKWTMRSDRAQNSRTEALNLIRNRKGNLPHIVVVTGEPMPARIASLALGTGDIDCVYHFALYELIEAVNEADAFCPCFSTTQPNILLALSQ